MHLLVKSVLHNNQNCQHIRMKCTVCDEHTYKNSYITWTWRIQSKSFISLQFHLSGLHGAAYTNILDVIFIRATQYSTSHRPDIQIQILFWILSGEYKICRMKQSNCGLHSTWVLTSQEACAGRDGMHYWFMCSPKYRRISFPFMSPTSSSVNIIQLKSPVDLSDWDRRSI